MSATQNLKRRLPAGLRRRLDALRLIEAALAASGLREVRRVLDLPCGGGRALRFLAVRFPRAEFVACDLQRDMADFCARQFGAQAAYSKDDLGELSFDRETGYGFTNYPDVSAYGVAPDAGYGISLTSPEWVRAEAARVGFVRQE